MLYADDTGQDVYHHVDAFAARHGRRDGHGVSVCVYDAAHERNALQRGGHRPHQGAVRIRAGPCVQDGGDPVGEPVHPAGPARYPAFRNARHGGKEHGVLHPEDVRVHAEHHRGHSHGRQGRLAIVFKHSVRRRSGDPENVRRLLQRQRDGEAARPVHRAQADLLLSRRVPGRASVPVADVRPGYQHHPGRHRDRTSTTGCWRKCSWPPPSRTRTRR